LEGIDQAITKTSTIISA